MSPDPRPCQLLHERFGCNQWWISVETKAQQDNDLTCGARRVALREALNESEHYEEAV